MVDKSAVCNGTCNTALTVIRSVDDTDLTVNIDDMPFLQQGNNTGNLIVTLNRSLYRQIAYRAAFDSSEQCGTVIIVGIAEPDDRMIMSVEAAAEPMIFKADRRSVDTRKVDIAHQMYRLSVHIIIVHDE